jgi:hypothetical protein
MLAFLITLGLALAQPHQTTPGSTELAGAVGAILVRTEAPDAHARAALVKELLALGNVAPLLFTALGEGRAPGGPEDGSGARLDDGQQALVLEATLALGRARLAAFLAETRTVPGDSVRLTAAVRIAGAGPFELDTLRGLLRLEAASSESVEEAFQPALVALLERQPHAYAELPGFWMELSPVLAGEAVQGFVELDELAAYRCALSLLGRRRELDEAIVLALGSLAHVAPSDESEALAASLVAAPPGASGMQRAVATTLGRLVAPDSVPYLIERLAADDTPLARAALMSLRAIGRAALPASIPAWRAWYAREETWWLERCPELAQALEAAVAENTDASTLGGFLREFSEHPLHREALVPYLEPALKHGDRSVRLLACDAVERLGARAAVPPLLTLLRGRDAGVAEAARAALVAITGVAWRDSPKAWMRELARRGFVASE